jgi:hypothetical protein
LVANRSDKKGLLGRGQSRSTPVNPDRIGAAGIVSRGASDRHTTHTMYLIFTDF